MADLTWRKSSRSAETWCVEVAPTSALVHVRDSKQGDRSPILSFTHDAWTSFLSGIQAGELRP